MSGVALTRRPDDSLVNGLLTYLERTVVDPALARCQHETYRLALAGAGWRLHEVLPAQGCPDAVFVEDTAVVVGDLAVLARPGAPQRRCEVDGTARALVDAGLATARIEEPGTLDGGDVLQIGDTVYVGRSARTNSDGVRQLRHLLAPLGRRVVAVPLGRVLHLKSAVTALPDGTVLAGPGVVDTAVFPAVRRVEEPGGCRVLPLGGDQVLIAASAPRTAAMLDDLGFTPVVVDISEFEKLEGSVTCLSVLVPGA